jgi:hypothetical protein
MQFLMTVLLKQTVVLAAIAKQLATSIDPVECSKNTTDNAFAFSV